MTLPEYLLRKNERPITWLFIRSWIPARTERYSWLRVAAFTVKSALLASLLLGVADVLFEAVSRLLVDNSGPATNMFFWSFFLPTLAEFAACLGLCWSVVSRICWNQRAARLAASPESPEATAPWPRLGLLRRSAWGLLYRTVVGLATPMLLFHAIENTRGAWAWRQMRAELKAKGECIDLACVIPPSARDEENFFATPFWQQFNHKKVTDAKGRTSTQWEQPTPFAYTTNFALPNEPETVKRINGVAKEPTDGRVDLAAWAAQMRSVTTNAAKARSGGRQLTFPMPAVPGDPAKDVLFALSKFDTTLSEFATAAPRPRNRYPTHYEDGFTALVPHLAALKTSVQICKLRAVARLAAGDSAGAAADTMLAFRLGESLREDPLLISQLVRFGCDIIALRALWEGMADHRWDDAQLAAFQELLGRRDYASGIVHAFEGERAMGNEMMEWLLRHRVNGVTELDRLGSDTPGNSDAPLPLLLIVPSGWLRQNQIGLLRGYQFIIDHGREAMNRTNRTVALAGDHLRKFDIDDYVVQMKTHPSPFNVLGGMLLPALGKSTDKANRAQATAGLAVVACALERYRLAHGTFPASLAELVPAYLPAVPTDWMGGQPLHYERTDNGWFRLWSIGGNGKDDGGTFRKLNDNGRRVSDDLDWPWPLPLPSRDARLF